MEEFKEMFDQKKYGELINKIEKNIQTVDENIKVASILAKSYFFNSDYLKAAEL